MDSDVLDIRSIFGLLKRGAWVILLFTALALGGAGLALLALKPVYTATTLVLVDPSKKNLLDPDAQVTGSGSESARVDSEVELVKSDTTLLTVAQELDLASDPEFGLSLGLRDTLLAFFRIAEPRLPTGEEALYAVVGGLYSSVSVQRRGLTYLIAISARSNRPQVAAAIANSVARHYISGQLEAKIASTLASAEIIEKRLTEASANVAQSERAFDEFVDNNIASISEATGRSDFVQLSDELERLNSFRLQSASIVAMAEEGLTRRDWTALATTLKDEAIANLERQRTALLGRLSGVAVNSQTEVDLRADLATLEADLSVAATEAVAGLRNELAQSQSRSSELRNQLRESILSADLPPDVLTNIYQLQQSAEISRAQYQTLLTRQRDLDTQAYLQVADSRVVAEATPPSSPSFPNPRLILALAGIVGLSLGIGFAFLMENVFGGFTSESQMETVLKVPVASAVPRQRPRGLGGKPSSSVADQMIVAPLSVFAESVRRVRIGVDQSVRKSRPPGGPEGIVIMVSSAAPNEGKTTVSLSLARAYALSGMSTLLIDCDLRKPNVHRQLGLSASEGLLDHLLGSKDIADVSSILTVDADSGAHIVVGSRRSDVATDQLVASKTFSRLISSARKSFDIVVLDTPPVGPVVDAMYLAESADAIVLVVKYSSTPQQEVKAAIASLTSAKRESTPILALLNQDAGSRAGYRGRYAGYYTEV